MRQIHKGGGQVYVQTGTRRQSGRSCGRLASTCPGKGDSRHRPQQIVAMWGGGPSAAGSSKVCKEAKNWNFYVKPPISKCCLKFLNMLCGAKYISGRLACDHFTRSISPTKTQTHTLLNPSLKFIYWVLFDWVPAIRNSRPCLFFFLSCKISSITYITHGKTNINFPWVILIGGLTVE